jgi:pyrroline-5-carboxylate reductase
MKKLGFIGGGNMAEALARGLIGKKIFKPGDLIVSDVDPARRRKLARSLKVETTADNLVVLRASRALLIAPRPLARASEVNHRGPRSSPQRNRSSPPTASSSRSPRVSRSRA